MKFDANLSEFNRGVAEALLPAFPADVKALQSDDGTLLFRGPIPLTNDQTHIGTHVAVSLDKDVRAALSAASPAATSAFNATIFSFFLDDIIGLPFDSNSTKVGVSPYIGTNGADKKRGGV